MRKKYHFTFLLLIFFMLFLSKDFLYGLFIPHNKINIKINSEYKDGKILYQNPYKFNEELIIALDTKDINKNDYVINESGLIGVIDKTYKNMAIVKLLTSTDIMMQVRVNDCYGILSYDKKTLIKNIGNHCKVKKEDKVYTSNLGYVDEEIYVGKIKKIIKDKNEITNDYEIDLENNKYVFNDYVKVIKRIKV